MSTAADNPEGPVEESTAHYTRAQALRRLASMTAGAAVAPTLFGSLASDAFAAQEVGTKFPTKFKDFKPFNPNLPAGPATGLPKVIATNIAAGSAYFIQLSDTVKKSVESRGYTFQTTT